MKKIAYLLITIGTLLATESIAQVKSLDFLHVLGLSKNEDALQGTCGLFDVNACCPAFKDHGGCDHTCKYLCDEAKAKCNEYCPSGSTIPNCVDCQFIFTCAIDCGILKRTCCPKGTILNSTSKISENP